MKYYEVCCKCGHVGRDKYVLKTFVVKARDGREAARVARQFPRVKHDHKDAIRSVNRITKERYDELYELNSSDVYFFCRSKQEQSLYCDLELFDEVRGEKTYKSEALSRKDIYRGKQKIRNPRKFVKFQFDDYEYAA